MEEGGKESYKAHDTKEQHLKYKKLMKLNLN